ncbi:MAG: hypothetical protein WBX15_13245 [Thermoanaerobaculia bacterium]
MKRISCEKLILDRERRHDQSSADSIFVKATPTGRQFLPIGRGVMF